MSHMLVLRAGQVFDGERSRGEAAVVIQDGKITDLDTSWVQPPEGAEVVDFGSDACLLPGLIDAHVHLAFDASAEVVTSLAACDDNAVSDRIETAAIRALRAGVTTVRDLGDRNYLSLKLSKRFPSATLPHIVAAGPPDHDQRRALLLPGGRGRGRGRAAGRGA